MNILCKFIVQITFLMPLTAPYATLEGRPHGVTLILEHGYDQDLTPSSFRIAKLPEKAYNSLIKLASDVSISEPQVYLALRQECSEVPGSEHTIFFKREKYRKLISVSRKELQMQSRIIDLLQKKYIVHSIGTLNPNSFRIQVVCSDTAAILASGPGNVVGYVHDYCRKEFITVGFINFLNNYLTIMFNNKNSKSFLYISTPNYAKISELEQERMNELDSAGIERNYLFSSTEILRILILLLNCMTSETCREELKLTKPTLGPADSRPFCFEAGIWEFAGVSTKVNPL